MRFNPPPNRPPAPPGWVPDAGWQPDPAWGPPPPGWQLWVPDDRPGDLAAAVDYPSGPFPPPQAPRSRTPLWLGLGALVVAVIVAAGALIAVTSRDSAPSSASAKPDITALSTDLLIDKSRFPTIGDDDVFTDWHEDDPDSFGPPEDLTVEPSDCADLPDAPRSATDSVGAKVSAFSLDHRLAYAVQLSIGDEQVPLARLVDACRTFTIADAGDEKLSATVQPEAIDGLPRWAVAYTIGFGGPDSDGGSGMAMQILSGYYRGLLVQAIGADDVDDPTDLDSFRSTTSEPLLTLFTAQVDELEAAP